MPFPAPFSSASVDSAGATSSDPSDHLHRAGYSRIRSLAHVVPAVGDDGPGAEFVRAGHGRHEAGQRPLSQLRVRGRRVDEVGGVQHDRADAGPRDLLHELVTLAAVEHTGGPVHRVAGEQLDGLAAGIGRVACRSWQACQLRHVDPEAHGPLLWLPSYHMNGFSFACALAKWYNLSEVTAVRASRRDHGGGADTLPCDIAVGPSGGISG